MGVNSADHQDLERLRNDADFPNDISILPLEGGKLHEDTIITIIASSSFCLHSDWQNYFSINNCPIPN